MPSPLRYSHGWRCNFKHDGKQHRRKFATKEACQKYIDRVTGNQAPDSQLGQQILEYCRWSDRHKARSTAVKDRYILRIFEAWCPARSVRDIDVAMIRKWQDYFFANAPFGARRQKTDNTANWMVYRKVLRTWYNWCISRGYADTNPFSAKEFKIKMRSKLPVTYTQEELAEIFRKLEAYEPIVRTFFFTLYHTGMRIGEAMALTWDRCQIEQRNIIVEAEKTGTVRNIPINSELLPALSALPRAGSLVFGGDRPYYLQNRWRQVLRQVTAKGTPHTFRHTFASRLVQKGVPLPAVQELLGHERIEQTMIYTHFSPKHLAAAVEELV